MKSLVRAGAALVGAAAALALGPAGIASADPTPANPGGPSLPAAHAVFVQTDSPAGNQIIVLAEHGDGRLSERQVVATGGLGAQAPGAVVDPLASQGSVVYDAVHRLLFAVNAGSGTLSVFSAQGRDLQLVQVVNSGGEFPDSIAVQGNLVYVLNAGGSGSVQGYGIFGRHLFALPNASASLGLSNTNPPNFLMGPGEIGFSPAGNELLVTTKASTSSIDTFAVGPAGQLSAAPTVTADPGNVPFSFVFSPAGQLVVAEAAVSAVHTFALGTSGALTSLGAVGDSQKALCWITTVGGYYYVANAGSADLSAYSVAANGLPSLVGTTGVVAATDAGPIDLAASRDGTKLYAETGGAGSIDEFQVNADGSLTSLGSVAGLGAGIEGIATD